MAVRLALENELERVNDIRKQVNDLHVSAKCDMFKPGFPQELQELLYDLWKDPHRMILVGTIGETIAGYAVVHFVIKPETPFMRERSFLELEEFGVDAACRRQGIASEMMAYICSYAKCRQVPRIELNVWEFNKEAMAFYESAGFKTYRRDMEIFV